MSDEYSGGDSLDLIKPDVLFFGGLVNPVTKVLFRFTRLPVKTFRFPPSAICPTHIVDFGRLRL